MLRANIESILYEGKTATQVGARVSSYDMKGRNCELVYKMINEEDGAYYIGTWKVTPTSVLESWGTDDTVLIQALADDKGFTITSFIQ